MRAIPVELQERLDSGATTLCVCWRVERADGLALGFTDHDEPVALDGLLCAPAGFSASALETATGLSVDNLRIAGALSDAALTETDIAQGRYDGAAVERWLVDWRRTDLRLLTFRGRIGEITRGDTGFSAEIEGLGAALNAPMGRAFLPVCDALLGDMRCRVDLSVEDFRGRGEVVGVEGPRALLVDGLGARKPGFFDHGVLRWTSGANVGLVAQVAEHHVREARHGLTLRRDAAAPIAPGDRFELDAGCDKSLVSCRDKFSNLLNFRGFPHMPGDSWLLATPTEGEVHDGGSRFR